jgi:hypothetical protein
MMQLLRALPVVGVCAIAAVVACSDAGPLQPDAPQTTLGTSGKTDTSKSTPPTTNPSAPKPDSGKTTPPTTNPTQPGPDTAGTVKRSSEPRPVSGIVFGMGPAGDSANYQRIAGATVVWTSFEGKELARAVTAADGSYSLGSFKPAGYMFTVTPPSNGPYKGIEWAFIISEFSPEKVEINVWLGRK